MTAPDPALTTRAEAAYPGVAHEIQIARAAFIAGALSEREAQPRDGHGHTFEQATRYRLHDIIWALQLENELYGRIEWEDAQKIGNVVFEALEPYFIQALQEAQKR